MTLHYLIGLFRHDQESAQWSSDFFPHQRVGSTAEHSRLCWVLQGGREMSNQPVVHVAVHKGCTIMV